MRRNLYLKNSIKIKKNFNIKTNMVIFLLKKKQSNKKLLVNIVKNKIFFKVIKIAIKKIF